jgi:3-hydroxyisobutyrate dehydrogenase
MTAASVPDALPTVSFLGLGAMGAPMAAQLARVSATPAQTLVWNRTASRAAAHAAEHGTTAATLEQAAGADVIFSCLPTSDEVLARVHEALPQLRDGQVWVDCTSGRPEAARELEALLGQRGVAFLDAPVSGGPGGARAGTLAVMVGGDAAVLERVRPLLDSFGGRVLRVGGSGSGFAVKAINNALMAVHVWSTGEGLLSLKAQGVDLGAALTIINAGSGRSYSSEFKFAQQVLNRRFDKSFGLGLLAKDAGIALDGVQQVKGSAPVLAQVAMLLRGAQAVVGDDADHTEMLKLLEQMNGEELA